MRTFAAVLIALLLAGCTSGGSPAPSSAAASRTFSASPFSGTSSSGKPSATPTRSAASVANGTDLRILDVTVVGAVEWVLADVRCAAGRCTALRRSADGGRTWRAVHLPTVTPLEDRPQRDCPCVNHVRFVSTRIGYVWGDHGVDNDNNGVLFVTTDAGRRWVTHRVPAVSALESLNGNVIRVTSRTTACPPACTYAAATASLGSSRWRSARLPGRGPVTSTSAQLARTGTRSYLLLTGNPVGGGNDARSVLHTSADGGRHWTNRGEPCPQSASEVDSSALSTAPDGTVAVLCTDRTNGHGKFVAQSSDGGRHFRIADRKALGAAKFVGGFAIASRSIVLVSTDETYRSTDGGRRFRRIGVAGDSGPGRLRYLGFSTESNAVGISADNRRLWTTHDAGRTWQSRRVR